MPLDPDGIQPDDPHRPGPATVRLAGDDGVEINVTARARLGVILAGEVEEVDHEALEAGDIRAQCSCQLWRRPRPGVRIERIRQARSR